MMRRHDVFIFKQKTAYEMRISDWSSDVCSSDLPLAEEDDAPKGTVLRDYHAENIMLIPDHASSHGLGLLDFQDALVGHPAYDLVSLLQDARRDVPPDIEDRKSTRLNSSH